MKGGRELVPATASDDGEGGGDKSSRHCTAWGMPTPGAPDGSRKSPGEPKVTETALTVIVSPFAKTAPATYRGDTTSISALHRMVQASSPRRKGPPERRSGVLTRRKSMNTACTRRGVGVVWRNGVEAPKMAGKGGGAETEAGSDSRRTGPRREHAREVKEPGVFTADGADVEEVLVFADLGLGGAPAVLPAPHL
ncbi:hypothetical protein HDU96_002990 [Phlyctochytrium bullatum]|nr:hypothetical protein HDU96_002990 [Phlyctochytrium bullatum]